ncbi:TetR/AcrR family transcriptional regulator [Shewanella fidelis]|uniref:Helix-turn-helix domain containing protein n=1 Tax=Shewanella fidelis TaxID=173509 RepID=A0AAW8NGZ4_9GAMM|nr:helix-turn-helix domain-containing protein [Shewanella fidelis]MDR8522617.1 helix-turn-helix domain containing protein [Shewanella fidelis]MDW4812233.1 helix-turn-helix domain containing protein [Shewanella fidelis]MDW4816103.1 helix-turn-helix domain containing protein [Shewanella fidelis]MDW4820474.1 helix-turn-helix domain containing protein [Shewanella fidelis]MDW4824696.1 helix-turn-helix domain containing protein [Shewanella fidelis]
MTVKQKKRGRPASHAEQLSQQAIMTKAKSLMLSSGKMPSIRALASALSVDAMAIYHYFKNKDALLEAITISLVNEIYQPNIEDDWQQALMALSSSYLNLLQQYSGLLETLLSMQSTGPAEVFMSRFEMILKPLDLDGALQTDILCLLVDYLHGFALASRCNTTPQSLDIAAIKGPLSLIFKAIEPLKSF